MSSPTESIHDCTARQIYDSTSFNQRSDIPSRGPNLFTQNSAITKWLQSSDSDEEPPRSPSNKRNEQELTSLSTKECSFKDRNELYVAIEDKRFEDAVAICRSNPHMAKVWVIKKGLDDEVILRRLPLHLSCIFRSPYELINSLLRAHEEGSRMADQWGNLPIHYVCEKGCASGDTIKRLLKAHPESLNIPGLRSMVPLAMVRRGSPPDKEMMLEEFHNFLLEDFSKQVDMNITKKDLTGESSYCILKTDSSQHVRSKKNMTMVDTEECVKAPPSEPSQECVKAPPHADDDDTIELHLRSRITDIEAQLENALSENAVMKDVISMLVKKIEDVDKTLKNKKKKRFTTRFSRRNLKADDFGDFAVIDDDVRSLISTHSSASTDVQKYARSECSTPNSTSTRLQDYSKTVTYH